MRTPLSNFCKLLGAFGGFFAPQKGKLNFTACSGAFASTLLATINIRNAPSTILVYIETVLITLFKVKM